MSKPITLLELDLGSVQAFWVNSAAFMWLVNFDGLYPLHDAWMLVGAPGPQAVTRVGSVRRDGIELSLVANAAACQAAEETYYYNAATKDLYIHLIDGDEPAIHGLSIGIVYGFVLSPDREPVDYEGFHYEPRLLSVPKVSRSKDPLFFGRIQMEGGMAEVANADGKLDRLAEDYDVFGNPARVLAGYLGDAYAGLARRYTGFVRTITVGRDKLGVDIRDKREALGRELPTRIFSADISPIKEGNEGKPIPLAWGPILNAPVVCTNEAEAPAPGAYIFQLADCTDHPYGIDAITEIRVEGVVVAPVSTDLLLGTFTLDPADYSPGDEVRADFTGFTDAGSNPIQNAADVIKDILITYFPIYYTADFFDTAEWAIATAAAKNIGLLVADRRQAIEIIEDICASILGYFLVLGDGRYTLRIFDASRPISQTIPKEEQFNDLSVKYNPEEVLTSLRVGYARDWGEEEFRWYSYTEREEELFVKYKLLQEKSFETLLTTAVDAAWVAGQIMLLSDAPGRYYSLATIRDALDRKIGDFIKEEINRPLKTMLGWAKAEVVGIKETDNGAEIDTRILSYY
jgi:hypothetical protein